MRPRGPTLSTTSTASITSATTLFAVVLASCGGNPTLVGDGEQGTTSNDESAGPYQSAASTVSETSDNTAATTELDMGVCGDGRLHTNLGETCDDAGESMTCNDDCTKANCGDGKLNTSSGEACDDGNDANADGCTNACTLPACGDGIAQLLDGEQCDDAGESGRCTATCTRKAWGPATLLHLQDIVSTTAGPKVAVNGLGNATAIWAAAPPLSSTYHIEANHYDGAADTWRAEGVAVTSGPSTNTQGIVIDDQGNTTIVWLRWDGMRANLHSTRYDAASDTWGTALLLSDQGGHVFDPEIAMNADGDAVAVWSQLDDTHRDVHAALYSAQTHTWSAPTLLESDDTGDANEPHVGIATNGDAIAVWKQDDGTAIRIYHNRYDVVTDSWGEASSVNTNEVGDTFTPRIAMHDNGDAMIVWGQDDGRSFLSFSTDVYVRRYSAMTQSFGPATTLAHPAAEPQVVALPSGDATVIWRQSDGGQWQSIYATRYDAPSASWTAPVVIANDPDPGPIDRYRLAASANGDVIAFWDAGINQRSAHVNRYDAQSEMWGTAISLAMDPEADARRLYVGMDDSGNAVAVWVHDFGAFGPPTSVYARHYR